MKKEKGISLIKLMIIISFILVIAYIIGHNQGRTMTNIEWGYMPSPEYYELRLAATTSEVYGSGKGTLSLESFNTLGRDVKKAKGKWFKKSNVNFMSLILDTDTTEMVTLTDGEHVAVFKFDDGANTVFYSFFDKKLLKDYNLTDFNYLGGYKITIK